ncbi:sulfatase [Labilibaculum filiforme]|uniref:Sulfatase n=1 Tax=Labilibaculum filiforme TaxID=1940526 RepID=A0A2N3I2J1_9BACT|nr:sulfatase [Labilibaculum filiforme]
MVFADDISAREIPIYGSSVWSPPEGGNTSDTNYRAKTPVMDKMAKDGCWFSTAWGATVCSPSRAMMMTGRYAHLHKWWHNGDLGRGINEKGKKGIWPLYESCPHTIGFVAKKAGYATYWAGKTQMKGSDVRLFGFDEGCLTPGEQGAEKNPYTDFVVSNKVVNGKKLLINEDTGKEVKYYAQTGWYWKPHIRLMNHPAASNSLEWWPNTAETQNDFGLNTYGPDVELDFIFDFMDRKNKEDKPFFIYHTSHLGHDGWDFFNPETKNKWPGTPKLEWKNGKYIRTTPNVTGDNGVYDTHGTVTESGIHNQINYLDYQLWQYINKLKEMQIEDNTILVFCADNGTSKYGKGSQESQKGVHVPLIIYAPGFELTKQGKQDILVNLSDILPTIASITGVKIPDDYEINGVSLWPYLTTNQTEHREWIYAYKKNKQLIRNNKVLHDGDGKWYDVREYPDDLISFPIIPKNTSANKYKVEQEKLQKILPQFDLHEAEHDAPKNAKNKIISDLELNKK